MSSLIVESLTVSYKNGSSHKPVLKDVDFSIAQGDFVCLCGPNGCGKSTLLSVLAGLNSGLNISSGSVKIDDSDLQKIKSKEKAKFISYMQQSEISVWNFSVFDFVLQGRFARADGGFYTSEDKEKVYSVLQELGIGDFSCRTVHNLSGGEFQKVRIARAMVQEPKFMLLDEPAASLDCVYEPQLLRMLKELSASKNIGIIVTIHDINLAYEYAGKLMLLPSGKNVLIGEPEAVMNSENLKLTFGVDLECKEKKSFQLLR